MEHRKGSVLDLFLILLLLLCAAGLLFRWHLLRESETDRGTEQIELVLESEAIDPLAIGCLSVGDWLYQASGEPIGRVLTLSYGEVETEVLANGVYYVGAWDREHLCSIQVTVLCEGRVSEDGVMRAEGALLSVGESVQLFSARSALRYRIWGMTQKTS